MWETITTYLYNTGDKALNVASSALEILAGVLGISIGTHGKPVPPVEIVTVPCDTTTSSPSPSTSTQSTTTSVAK
uniref:Uncharacterized protein n=1 Tax=Panagrolaimus superbus TaxID=310955 RepID=A0A914Z7R9_9BILA